MGRYPTGPETCVAPPAGTCIPKVGTDLGKPGPVLIFCFWGFVILCCGGFLLYKRMMLKKRSVKPLLMSEHETHAASSDKDLSPKVNAASLAKELSLKDSPMEVDKAGSSMALDSRLDLAEENILEFQGYKETLWGRLCFTVCCLTSLQWIALYILVLWDFYADCQLTGIDNFCFYGTYFISGGYLMNGQVFFVVWVLATTWFTTWVTCKGKVRNWFRFQCPMSEAMCVLVWAPNEEEILSQNVYPIILWIRRMKAVLFPPSMRGHSQTIPVESTKAGQRYFLFEGTRFLIHKDSLHRSELKVGDDYIDFHNAAKGLTSEEAAARLDHVGPNEIPFSVDGLWLLIFNEYFNHFYNYQLTFYILWFWSSYLLVATMLGVVVVLSSLINMYLTNRSQRAIAKISEYVTEADVLRDGKWVKVNSRDMVPGDLVKLRSDWLLPCDLVIINGSCVCNESALTGEAMPVQKYQCANEAENYSPHHTGARHTLFAGTTLLQAGSNPDDVVLGVVSATGMATGKGELMSAILFQSSMSFKYDEEIVVVVSLMIAYASVCAILAIVIQVIKGQQSVWVTKWIYMVFIISQILSPILPVALNVGQMNAADRLKKKGISCLNAKRIAISGKIRCFCFDKTGTLTKDGLEFLGVRAIFNGAFSALLTPADKTHTIPDTVTRGLATCHAVSRFGDGYVGNQVEVRMFEATGWELIEAQGAANVVKDPKDGTELAIVRKNEFDHARATMSVIVADKTGEHFVFCKGSFEKIGDISRPESVPADYLKEAHSHALDGCYVLGMSWKSLGVMRPEEALRLSRDEVEADLSFCNLLLFRNELKPDTRDAIIELKEGACRVVMITGDNAQCGQYIAKASGMSAPDCLIYLADVSPTSKGDVGWTPMGTENAGCPSMSMVELLNTQMEAMKAGKVELAVTGKAFRVLRRTQHMQDLLFFCRIFARCTPDEKVQVCGLHRDAGLVIGMCGDGGNDCGALRAAHAGMALSDAEASVVSPFTSKSKSVRSVVDLVSEGRGALHTSFAAVKFLIIYGLNFSILKLCSYWYGTIVCSFMYLSIDGFAVLFLGWSITLSRPAKKLSQRRPTSSLIGPLHVASVFGYFCINLAYLVGALFLMQADSDYVAWPTKLSHGQSWWTLGDCWEATVLFFTLYFQFISASFIFSFGSDFRRIVFRNWSLLFFYIFLMVFYSWLLLTDENEVTRYYHIASEQFNAPGVTLAQSPVWAVYQENGGAPSPAMSKAFRFKLWGLCMGNVLTLIFWQKVVAEGIVSNLVRKRFASKRPVFNM